MYNTDKENNQAIIDLLVKQEGYKDLGWANSGNSFSSNNTIKRSLNCSTFRFSGTHYVYIDDVNKEILHVDMSD